MASSGRYVNANISRRVKSAADVHNQNMTVIRHPA